MLDAPRRPFDAADALDEVRRTAGNPPSLPLELIQRVVAVALEGESEAASRRRLCVVLCRVCRALHRLCLPHLYSQVALTTKEMAFLFCRSARYNPSLVSSHLDAIFYGMNLWGAVEPFDGELPKPSSPRLREAAWYAQTEMGGLLVGHAWSSREVGEWCRSVIDDDDGAWLARARRSGDDDEPESELSREMRLIREAESAASTKGGGGDGGGKRMSGGDAKDIPAEPGMYASSGTTCDETFEPPPAPVRRRVAWAYHVCTPSVEHWMWRRFSALRTLTHVSLTIYPGLPIDDDKLEFVLTSMLSSSPLLRHLVVFLGHDQPSLGSRMRRMHRSVSVQRAVERIGDARLRVETAPWSFGGYGDASGKTLGQSVVKYMMHGWEDRLKGRPGAWPDPFDERGADGRERNGAGDHSTKE